MNVWVYVSLVDSGAYVGGHVNSRSTVNRGGFFAGANLICFSVPLSEKSPMKTQRISLA